MQDTGVFIGDLSPIHGLIESQDTAWTSANWGTEGT